MTPWDGSSASIPGMRIPLALPARGAAPYDVTGIGLNSLDLIVTVAEHPARNTKQQMRGFVQQPGGQTATAMVTCARLGWRARYVGRFGDDEFGRLGLESLTSEGVDVSACEVVREVSSQFAVILVDEASGDRTVLWNRHPGLYGNPDKAPEAAALSGRILLVDCHETALSTKVAARARAAGRRTVVDVEKVRPGIDALLREIDVIIAAEAFPGELTGCSEPGRALERLSGDSRAAVVCVTLGREGSLARVGGREIRTPGFVVPVVDSTGAGDVFRGGFISGWLAGGEAAEVEDVLRYANAVAALKCRAPGARAGIPRPPEVEALLRGPLV